MSERIHRSNGTNDNDNDEATGESGHATKPNHPDNRVPPHKPKTTGIPAEHQEAEGWKTVRNKNDERSIATEKSKRFKLRIQVNMNIREQHQHTGTINVPYHQRLFCSELFKADQSANILKWDEAEDKNGTKTNPITTIKQLPTGKKSLSSWIAGAKGVTDRNNKQTLQFFLYVETSVNYGTIRKVLKPWLDTNQHRMFITQLSTTNNRLLAWIKGAHPDWTRIGELQSALQKLVVNQDNEYSHCELDLRPRRIQIGKGPQALFIWTVGITCGLSNVQGYMRALWKGLSQADVPNNLRHIQILPIHPIPGLINNQELASLARNHDNLMDQLKKKSVIGFADIFSPQHLTKPDDDNVTSNSLQDYLLQQKSNSNTNLFHSVESRGKNGYLVIYREHLQQEVETFFLNMRSKMLATFEDQFVDEYFKAIQNHLDEIEITDDNSAVSTYSAGETYFKGIKNEVQNVTFIHDDTTATTTTTPTTQSGKFQSRKRGQTLNLGGYGDDVSSLGSRSTKQPNIWTQPRSTANNTNTATVTGESESVTTLRTEVQEWLEDLKEDNKIEWEQNILEIRNLNTQMKEDFKETIQEMQNNHTKELQEQRDMFKDIISRQIKDIVNQTVIQQFEKHHAESTPKSPIRKQQKTTNITETATSLQNTSLSHESEDDTPRLTRRLRVSRTPTGQSKS